MTLFSEIFHHAVQTLQQFNKSIRIQRREHIGASAKAFIIHSTTTCTFRSFSPFSLPESFVPEGSEQRIEIAYLNGSEVDFVDVLAVQDDDLCVLETLHHLLMILTKVFYQVYPEIIDSWE